MIIRPLRPDEARKLNAVSSIAFNFSADLEKEDKITSEVLGAFLDDGETIMSVIFPNNYKSNYCGEFLPCVGIGGVATLPEHRRGGGVRAIFDEIFRLAPERGWATSYLYPFSYNYYRQYGYEKVMSRKSFNFPTSSLSTFARDTNCTLYEGQPEIMADIKKVYYAFAAKFNIIFERGEYFHGASSTPHKDKRYTYVHYTNKTADAYVMFEIHGDTFVVNELAYTDTAALAGILGFIRMYEGQVDSVSIRNQPMDSELEYMIRDYSNVSVRVEGGGMARVVLVEELLKKNAYPVSAGRFSLRVNDYLEYNRAVFVVEYTDGKATVVKKSYDSKFDIECDIPALSRVMLGECDFSLDAVSFMPGVSVIDTAGAEAFFRAFPRRRMCLYDWF
jgi:Predicted acetyltransferase involved in intracellular survival and related acetyltransferases